MTLNLEAARKARAAREVASDAPDGGASPKQVAFIDSLVDECRELQTALGRGADLPARVPTGDLAAIDKRTASATIDILIKCRDGLRAEKREADRAAREAARKAPVVDVVPEGIHFLDGSVFKVQRAVHGSGNLYAKRLVPEHESWAYEGRAPLKDLSEDTLMTLEQAREFGHLYGVCCRCGRLLTDEASIEAGIGPVCAGKGWR